MMITRTSARDTDFFFLFSLFRNTKAPQGIGGLDPLDLTCDAQPLHILRVIISTTPFAFVCVIYERRYESWLEFPALRPRQSKLASELQENSDGGSL